MEVIKRGNIACHWENVQADYSLYRLGYEHLQTSEKFFQSIYAVRLSHSSFKCVTLSSKVTEALNLRGKMAFCF